MTASIRWADVSDDKLFDARDHLEDYTEAGQRAILEEVARRQNATGSTGHDADDDDPFGTAAHGSISIGAQLEKRYRDAYRVARATTMIAGVIKFFGVAAGVIGLVVAYMTADQSGALTVVAAGLGVIVGLVVYGLGVIIAAQGQQLLAAIDGVVGSSPFLSDEDRAAIMRLDIGDTE